MDDLKEMTRSLDACNETILNMGVKIAALESEVQTYRNAARLYGIDPATMLTLANTICCAVKLFHAADFDYIGTCADNIRLIEKMQEVFELFRYVPEDLTEQEVVSAITQYDGDGSKPYCDLVYCGLSIIRKYLKKRSEYDEWRKGNLPEGF